jgi:hypothetical protein
MTAWHGFDRYDFLMDEASLKQHNHESNTPERRSDGRRP